MLMQLYNPKKNIEVATSTYFKTKTWQWLGFLFGKIFPFCHISLKGRNRIQDPKRRNLVHVG